MNFKQFFENENAHPFPQSTIKNIVYHGTNNKPFSQFEYKKSYRTVLFSQFEVETKGFFFSESPHDALEYGQNVAACYIDLRNPLLDPRRDRHLAIEGLSEKKEIDMMKILSPMIQKDQGGHYIDYMINKSYLQHRNRSTAREWIYDAIDTNGLVWDVLDNPQVIQKMKNLGYDGTFVSETTTSLGRSIFVMSSQQIHVVKWVKGPQEHWKDKDDYYVKKVDGYSNLYSP